MRELTTTHQGWVGHGGSMVISARQAALCTAVTERIIRSHPETAPVLLSHVGESAAKALLCVESFDQELVEGMLRFGSIRGSAAFALHPSVPEDVVEGTHAWQRSAAAEALAGLAAGSSAAWGLLPKISTPAIEALLFSADPDRWLVRVESRILGGERIEVSSVLVGKILMRDPLLSGLVPFFGKDGRVGLGGFSAVWQMCDLVWGDSTEEGSLRAEVQEVSMRREVVARAESVLRAEGGREPFISLAGANAALADLECLIEMVLLLGRADEATSETAKVEVSL